MLDSQIKIYDYIIAHRDGRSIYHEGGALTVDKTLLSGMLAALTLISQELFEGRKSLKLVEVGDKKIVCELGKHLLIGAIADTEDIRMVLRELVNRIEEKYQSILEVWDGNLDDFKPIILEVQKSLSKHLILPVEDVETIFEDPKRLQNYFFKLKGKLSVSDIREIKDLLGKFEESKLRLALNLLSEGIYNFFQIKNASDLDAVTLLTLLQFMAKRKLIEVFRAPEGELSIQTITPVKLASVESYNAEIRDVREGRDYANLSLSLKIKNVRTEGLVLLIPLIVAVGRVGGKTVPQVLKGGVKIRELIAKELIRQSLDSQQIKELNIMKTLKRIDEMW
ncbi:MAG: hypothetical protein ACTSSJ_02030 [Candidatus Odinarchaeia archaeon]